MAHTNAQQDVEQVLRDYALAADSGDAAALRRLFADDATARYARDDELVGGDAIAEWLGGALGAVVYGQHAITPNLVDFDEDGQRADVVAYLVSFQVLESDLDQALEMHSTYRTTVRLEDRWVIERLELDVGWIEIRSADQTELMKLTRTMPEENA